ncbi:hypothetical protein C8Q75DRAFT_773928 [Abortiporus biennis]|nr:hypothetical protein C8Q75DRAFT_773928 [Abortiporus biennis]
MTNIETKKQQYSRELAAYTLRQWDVARQSLQTDNTEPGAKSSHRSSRSNSASRDPTLASQVNRLREKIAQTFTKHRA